MQVSYDVVVPQPVDVVWQSLTDVDGVLAALPGAALARGGDTISGSLKCKLGATQVTYRLTVGVEVSEPEFRSAVLTVAGQEARGTGTLTAVLAVALRAVGGETSLEITGEVEATGRGESAGSLAWQRVIMLLVNAVVPPVAATPLPEPAPRPRPPLAVAPMPAESATGPAIPPWAAIAAALALLLLVVRRRRRS